MNQRFSKCARLQDELELGRPQSTTHSHSTKARRNAFSKPNKEQDSDWVPDTEEDDADAMDVDCEGLGQTVPLNLHEFVGNDACHDRPQAAHFQSGPDWSQYHVTEHPSAASVYGQGKTFMDEFRKDEFAHCREETGNMYYPFASSAEWELGSFLLRSPLSMADTDKFLKLDMVSLQTLVLLDTHMLIINITLCHVD